MAGVAKNLSAMLEDRYFPEVQSENPRERRLA